MAVEDLQYSGKRKRKRESGNRKLPVNERVEVRSLEEGFLGSWHPGTVIHCGKQKRHVKYDHVLDDNGSNYLVDVVDVPDVWDGASSTNCNNRGFIRPLPPLMEFGKWDLTFGLCVDVNYQEAWWEGVIFDHCDGMEERCIFFPDLGDEMKIGVAQLRITHDWNKVTEDWERRGMWVFLELVEECEEDTYVAVSVKQIWYDVRTRKDFDQIRDWTCNVKDLWRVMVMEVINDYFTLTLEEVFTVLDLSKGFFKEALEQESGEPTVNIHLNLKSDMANCQPVVNSDNQSNNNTNVYYDADMESLGDGATNMSIMGDLDMSFPKKEVLVQKESISPVEEVLTNLPEGISCCAAGEVVSSASCYEKKKQQRCSTRSRSLYWQPLKLSGVELCPDAVNQYEFASEKKIKEHLTTQLRKHLAYLGWKIEWTEDNGCFAGRRRYKYTSPDKQGKQVYMSLRQVCKYIRKNNNMNYLLSEDDQIRMYPTVDSTISCQLLDQPKKCHDPDVFPAVVPPPPPSKAVVEPEFCPEAVLKYYLHAFEKGSKADKKNMILKAKKHLLAEGWNFGYPAEKGKGLTYKSPQNRCFGSLRVACRFYIEESLPKWISSGIGPLDVSAINEVSHVDYSDKLLRCVSQLLQKEQEFHDVNGVPASILTGNHKLKRSRNSKAILPKIQRKGLPIRLLRSSKRVQKACTPCPSQQKPQNVLSWLIDCNIVLPRDKVLYRARGTCRPMAEGRITRDGIKCSCCQRLYSLGGFEVHANGRSSRRPSASIFLKDGRSLLDCQIQIMHDRRTLGTMERPSKDTCQAENDCICSACHYGGELILCDQCPSSFHKSCLALEDIPEGDWFCPSCRCGICGQSKIEGAEDGKFLTCFQCEHKYHARCLNKRSVVKAGKYLENWFCGKSCEKIYSSLHKLLGEPVALGVNNLSWTLLKFVNFESCDLGSSNNDFLAESHSKLNVSLSVMHECFEPLKELYSGRDLMEDVLFSKWSELNRLNFQGFYTILLERNEELISVATVRVHGEKVAEVPLVGTRFQYRRLGMCRILMNELEKMLKQLGVERLVLPAVPSVLGTWTTSFGFSEMTNSERSQFLDYTFLDFQDTIMCQKLLMKSPLDLVLSTETQSKPHDILSTSGSIICDQSSPVSEVYQAEETDKSGGQDLQMVDSSLENFVLVSLRVSANNYLLGVSLSNMQSASAGNNYNLGSADIDPVAMPNLQGNQLQNGTSPECSLEDDHLKDVGMYDGPFKCYKRRNVSRT